MSITYTDPAVNAYIAFREADIRWIGAEIVLDKMEGDLPGPRIFVEKDGTDWTEKNDPNRKKIICIDSYAVIQRTWPPMSKNASIGVEVRRKFKAQLEAHELAMTENKGILDQTKSAVDRHKSQLHATKAQLFNTTPTTMFGAALKLNAIASFNVYEGEACIDLQDEMLAMAEKEGFSVDDLPVAIFDLWDMITPRRKAA